MAKKSMKFPGGSKFAKIKAVVKGGKKPVKKITKKVYKKK